MIFLRLSDGLGNQMFQYAYARYLQEKYKEVIWINTETYCDSTNRNYSLHHFRLNPNVYVMKGLPSKLIYQRINHIYEQYRDEWQGKDYFDEIKDSNSKKELAKEKGLYIALPSSFRYYDFPETSCKNKLVIGFFQSHKYFDGIGNILKREFSLREHLPHQAIELKRQMKESNSVCVHIRRGDYLSVKWRALNVCNEEYYLKAMDLIAEEVDDPVFYIFSNTGADLKWIQNNYHFRYPVKYVDMNNPDYVELNLMSACKHFIISNSTYSWWAQYLSKNSEKIVVAPSEWYKSKEYRNLDNDIYMDEWRIVEV